MLKVYFLFLKWTAESSAAAFASWNLMTNHFFLVSSNYLYLVVSYLCVQYVIDLFDNSEELSEVENIGIEPMTSCMPCKRSSQLS